MTFIKFSQTIDGVYENLEDYNPTKKRNVSIVFDDMIRRLIGWADMEVNKKLESHSHWIVFERKKTQHLTCFCVTTLFQSAWNYNTKRNTLFYCENT